MVLKQVNATFTQEDWDALAALKAALGLTWEEFIKQGAEALRKQEEKTRV